MVGVNPETAHEHMAGLNFLHGVAQAWEVGKLFHIDLNDQRFGRYDQDFRFGMVDIKSAFFLVKFLEDVKYDGARHFDAHAFRTEDYEGVKDFGRGCMRTYLILKEKAEQWNKDREIQSLVEELNSDKDGASALLGTYSPERLAKIRATNFDRIEIAKRGMAYELLDQLTMDLLMGVR
jgi:xylose isomerase